MPLLRDKKNKDDNPLDAPVEGASAIPKDSPGGKLRDAPRGDYTHGHPGVPPTDYQAPRESRR